MIYYKCVTGKHKYDDSLSTWAARFFTFFTRRPPSFGSELEVHIALAVTEFYLLCKFIETRHRAAFAIFKAGNKSDQEGCPTDREHGVAAPCSFSFVRYAGKTVIYYICRCAQPTLNSPQQAVTHFYALLLKALRRQRRGAFCFFANSLKTRLKLA